MSDNSSYTVFCHKDDFIDKAAKIFNKFGFVVLKKSTQISNLASLKEDIDRAIKGKKIKEPLGIFTTLKTVKLAAHIICLVTFRVTTTSDKQIFLNNL